MMNILMRLRAFDVEIHARGQEIAVKGPKIEPVEKSELVLKIY